MDLSLLRTNYRLVVHTHPDNTSEHNLIFFEDGSPPRGNNLYNLSLDMSNFANQVTLREYRKINYTDYILVDKAVYPDDFDPGVKTINIELDGQGGDMKITMQSTTPEIMGTSLDIQYSETKR